MITHRQIDSANNNRRQGGGCKQYFFPAELVTGVQANRLAHCWYSHHASLAHLPHKRLSWLFSFVFAFAPVCLFTRFMVCLFVFFLHTSWFSSHPMHFEYSPHFPFLPDDESCFRFSFSQFHLAIMSFFLALRRESGKEIFMIVTN